MSELTDKQAEFASMVGKLIAFVDDLEDYRVRLDWAYRSVAANRMIHGHTRSLHCKRLAIDLVLDIRNGHGVWVYQTDSYPYTPLGEFWESIGGAWGGRFGDGGHFSSSYQGMK